MIRFILIGLLVLTGACTATQSVRDSHKGDRLFEAPANAWLFSENAARLRAKSCPKELAYTPAGEIAIHAQPIPIGPQSMLDAVLPKGARFLGGWHLTSDNHNFGGLSGLDILPSGDLLGVSDAGAFVWISMKDGAPAGGGRLAYMRGSNGQLLPGKRAADAEGLAIREGLALVSFEQDHRILAFDLKGCGAEARGVLTATLPNRLIKKKIAPNKGAEALRLDAQGRLVFGYEAVLMGGAHSGWVRADGSGEFDTVTIPPPGLSLVGFADGLQLYRAYDPLRGNRNVIRFESGDEIRLERPLQMDNFEGIAVQSLPAGGRRIYIISDDNFSARQRTLLYVFEVAG